MSPRWTDFRRYLAESDNRYHVRLGFLALAERTTAGVAVDRGVSPSDRESMDGVGEVHIDRDVVEGRKEPVRVYAAKDKTGDAA